MPYISFDYIDSKCIKRECFGRQHKAYGKNFVRESQGLGEVFQGSLRLLGSNDINGFSPKLKIPLGRGHPKYKLYLSKFKA